MNALGQPSESVLDPKKSKHNVQGNFHRDAIFKFWRIAGSSIFDADFLRSIAAFSIVVICPSPNAYITVNAGHCGNAGNTKAAGQRMGH